MVSDTVEIDSLRYISPIEKSVSINYTLNVKDKFIDQKKSSKSVYGTSIALQLRDDYAKKLEGLRLKEIIEESMNYFEISINLALDGNSYLLDNRAIAIPEEYKDINGVLLLEVNDVPWLEGHVVLHQSQHQSVIAPSKISQQCFVITGKNSTLNTSPHWVGFSRYFLNILPPKNLTLKANRNSVHEDDNLRALRDFIIEFIIGQFKSLENKALIWQYLSDGRGNALSGNRAEYEFLTDLPLFHFFNPQSGRTTQSSFKQIGQKVKAGGNIIVLNPLLIDKVSLKEIENNLILLHTPIINYFYQFAEPFIQSNVLVVSGLPGLIYYSITLQSDIKLDISKYNLKYSWVRDYPVLYLTNYTDIFCVVGNNQYNSIDVQFNEKNKLGKLLKEKSKNTYVKRFSGSLKTNLSMALRQKAKIEDYHKFDGEHHFFMIDNMHPYSLDCIGLINGKFLSSLNNSLMKDLLKPLQSDGQLEEKDLNDYLLTKDNFPAWWFRN